MLSLKNPAPKKSGFLALPRRARYSLYLPLFCALLFFGLRWFERAVTYHPVRYTPGPQWARPANAEEVWFTSADGVKLNGWFVHTAHQPSTGTVLYCHGNAGNLTDVSRLACDLADYGLDVMIFDYRGYGRSGGEVTDEWGLDADGDAAYDYLTRERGVKPERLAIYGLSLGTTIAADVASRKPCGALVLESGLSSASEMADVAAPWLPRWLHWLGKNRFESARKLASVNSPVLVVHGTADEVIPVEQGERLYAAARNPKKLIIVPGGHHWLPAGGRAYLDSVAEFIRGALKQGN